MTENNAAKPELTEAELDAIHATMQNYAACNINVFTFIARAIESALLSKLRAEGVQAGDERETFEAHMKEKFGGLVEPWDARRGRYGFGPDNTRWEGWHDRAALASAPVAGEADDEEAADAWRRLALQFDGHRMQALGHLRAMLADPQEHADHATEFLAAPPQSGEQVLAERIRALAAPQASEAVRNALAELVRLQDAKDSQNHFPNPQRSNEWAEYRRLWPAAMEQARAALTTQADKDGGDCAKGAGDVAMRDAARWRSFRNAVTQQDMGWLDRMDAALTAMGCDLDDEAPPNADQVDAAADAAMAALSAQPGAQRNG